MVAHKIELRVRMQAHIESHPQPPPARASSPVPRVAKETLFTRWLVIVYVPLGVFAAALILFILGALPSWGNPLLLVLSIWGLLAVRLLWERRRRGLAVPPPRSMVIGIGSTALIALIGAVLSWTGVERLASTSGVVMLYLGGVLMLTAVLAPVFKVLDVGIRAVARRVLGETRPRA